MSDNEEIWKITEIEEKADKKKIEMFAVIGCIICNGLFIDGCRMPDITKGVFLSGNTRLYDVKTYKLSGDVTFLPISVQAINNSDEGPTVITEFVNIKDEMVWMQSYKEYSGSHGGGF